MKTFNILLAMYPDKVTLIIICNFEYIEYIECNKLFYSCNKTRSIWSILPFNIRSRNRKNSLRRCENYIIFLINDEFVIDQNSCRLVFCSVQFYTGVMLTYLVRTNTWKQQVFLIFCTSFEANLYL